MNRKLWMASALSLLLFMTPMSVYANSPYEGYIYDSLRNTPESINGYLYKDSIEGIDLNIGSFKDPQDIFVAEDDTLYLADSGNNRVIHLNKNKVVLGIIGPEEGDGMLSNPKGVFVTNEGDIYVADTGNQRIVHFDPEGQFVKEFKKPDSPLLDDGFTFTPSKVILDKRGYMFVVSEGAHQGLLQLRPDGSFAGFFGANHVEFSVMRLLIKYIATNEQREQLASVRPPEFSNLFQDNEGFIYTSTFGIRTNQIKRLSAVGVDVLNIDEVNDNQRRYGDYYMPTENWKPLYEAFVDVTVDQNGVITALDQTTGKAFQYDQLGNLLFIFGGLGDQKGLFMTPSSIGQTSDGTMYIVDKTRNRIDRFHTTPFADKVHEATKLYVEGKYEQASKPWHDVIEMNSNYDLAYKAIGKSLYKAERYKEAMYYFEVAKDRPGYSEAFLEYRKVFLREHFEIVFGGIIFLYVLSKIIKFWIKRRRRIAANPTNSTLVKGGKSL
jgi:DNA-binding beta-propeller fold protein YncE